MLTEVATGVFLVQAMIRTNNPTWILQKPRPIQIQEGERVAKNWQQFPKLLPVLSHLRHKRGFLFTISTNGDRKWVRKNRLDPSARQKRNLVHPLQVSPLCYLYVEINIVFQSEVLGPLAGGTPGLVGGKSKECRKKTIWMRHNRFLKTKLFFFVFLACLEMSEEVCVCVGVETHVMDFRRFSSRCWHGSCISPAHGMRTVFISAAVLAKHFREGSLGG